MTDDRDVSEALEEKVEHFQAMVYKCSVGFATEDDIEYAKEALLSEIRDLREKLEEVREERDETQMLLDGCEEALQRMRGELGCAEGESGSRKARKIRRQRDELREQVEAARKIIEYHGDVESRMRREYDDALIRAERAESRLNEFREAAREADEWLENALITMRKTASDEYKGYDDWLGCAETMELDIKHARDRLSAALDQSGQPAGDGSDASSHGADADETESGEKHNEEMENWMCECGHPEYAHVTDGVSNKGYSHGECRRCDCSNYDPADTYPEPVHGADADEVGEEPTWSLVDEIEAVRSRARLSRQQEHTLTKAADAIRTLEDKLSQRRSQLLALERRLDHPTDPPDEGEVDAFCDGHRYGWDNEPLVGALDRWRADDQPGEDGVGEGDRTAFPDDHVVRVRATVREAVMDGTPVSRVKGAVEDGLREAGFFCTDHPTDPPDEGEQERVHTMKRGGPGPIRGADDQPGEDGVGEVRKAVGRALRSATAMEHPEMEIADPRGYWISREAYLALDQLMRERLTDPTDPPDEGEGVRVGPQASDKCGVEGCGHARHVHGTKFQDDDEKTGGCLVEGCGCLAFRHADDQPGEDETRTEAKGGDGGEDPRHGMHMSEVSGQEDETPAGKQEVTAPGEGSGEDTVRACAYCGSITDDLKPFKVGKAIEYRCAECRTDADQPGEDGVGEQEREHENLSRDEVIARFCQLQAKVSHKVIGYGVPNDCFCEQPEEGGLKPGHSERGHFRNSGAALRWIEEAVERRLTDRPEDPDEEDDGG